MLGNYVFVLQGADRIARGSDGIRPAWSPILRILLLPVLSVIVSLATAAGALVRILATQGASFVVPILLAHSGVLGLWKPIHHLSDFLAGIAAAGIYSISSPGREQLPKWLGVSIYLPAISPQARRLFCVHRRSRWHRP